MTSGIASKGVDLDDIFDPWQPGTSKARATAISSAGADINGRYAPLVYGSSAAATGIHSQGADLNTLFAAKGTANYTLPIDGQSYVAAGASSGVAPIKPCSGTLYLQVGGGQINIQKRTISNGGAAVVSNVTYALPTGAAYLRVTTSGITQQGNASQTNAASTWITIPAALTTELTFTASQSGNAGTSEINGSVTLAIGPTQSAVWSGTCSFDAVADISA